MRVWILEHQQSQPRAFAEGFDMHEYLRDDIIDGLQNMQDQGYECRVASDDIFIDDWLHARLVEVEGV